jgi:hypothetical protein
LVILGSVLIAVKDLLGVNLLFEDGVVPHVNVFDLLLQFFLVDEWNRAAIGCLNKNLSGEGTLVLESHLASGLLAEDYLSEVNACIFGTLEVDQGFLAGADEGQVNGTGLREQWQYTFDVLVQLRGEGNRDGCGQTCTHSPARGVLNVEEVLYCVMQGQQFE